MVKQYPRTMGCKKRQGFFSVEKGQLLEQEKGGPGCAFCT